MGQDRRPLSRTAVLEAGIALADAEGLGAVTMRRLGEALGVEAMSLYRHVANKQDVLDGMVSLLVARMEPEGVSPSMPWQEVLRRISWAYRRLIVAHPAVFTAQAGRPLALDEDDTAAARVLATLKAAGFSHELALDLHHVGSSFARGFALTDIALAGTGSLLAVEGDADRAFSRGLDVIIEGFERLRDDADPASTSHRVPRS